MKQIKFSFILIVLFMVSLVCAPSARGQLKHTFVSRTGNDANDCAVATPCRTFSGAETKTNAGGDITALDTGLYSVITINKALTIQAAPGVNAALDAGPNQAAAATVSAGSTEVVVIRNLSLVNNGSATTGLLIKTAGSVHVENCVITGFAGPSGFGVNLQSNSTQLFLQDTVIRNNGSGLILSGTVVIDHCRIENNNTTGAGYGVGVGTKAKVTISDSVVAGNAIGLSLQFSTEGELNVERCVVSHNSNAGISIISAPAAAGIVRVSNSTVTNNGIGFDNEKGSFRSRGNNLVLGNVKNVVGTITPITGT